MYALVEHIGSGIPSILKKYDRSALNFSTNFLRITYPYPESVAERNEQNEDNRHPDKSLPAKTGDKPVITNSYYIYLMDYLKTHDSITSSEAMVVLNLKASQTRQILREMAKKNLLEAQGENRNRYYVMSTEKAI